MLLLSACSDKKEQLLENHLAVLDTEIAGLEKIIGGLESQFDALSNQVAALSNQVGWLDLLVNNIGDVQIDHTREIAESKRDTVVLHVSEKGFQRIDTENGSFLIACQDVTPYLDGYKVRFSIGNPSSASYQGFKLTAQWGKKMPAKPRADWVKSLGYKQMTFTETLFPGAWNDVEIILSPAKSDDLGYLEMHMETDTVRLNKPQSASE